MNRKDKANNRSADFFDTDLITDRHDEIMIWLDANVSDIFRDMCLGDVEYKIWEHPIKRGEHKYMTIVGYIDMLVRAEKIEQPSDEYTEQYKAMSDNQKQHYPDLSPYVAKKNYGLEVKSKINNIGEVIRQINQYRTYTRDIQYFIVCPDDSYAEIFKSQGIGFIKAEI